MNKKNPFVLIRERRGVTEQTWESLRNSLCKLDPAISSVLAAIPKQMVRTLVTSALGEELHKADLKGVMQRLTRVAHEYKRQQKVLQIGIWDINAQVGRLPELIERLNKAQSAFIFFQLESAIPAGFISKKERVIAWASKRGMELTATDRKEIAENMIADDFYKLSRRIRLDFKLDYLIGLTSSMVAFIEDGNVSWNYFSTWQNSLILVSTYDLRRFARKAGADFEAAVGQLIVAPLLAAISPGLDFHDQTRGCLFDKNEDRESIVESLKCVSIDDACLEDIPTKYHDAALAFVRLFKNYHRTANSQPRERLTV